VSQNAAKFKILSTVASVPPESGAGKVDLLVGMRPVPPDPSIFLGRRFHAKGIIFALNEALARSTVVNGARDTRPKFVAKPAVAPGEERLLLTYGDHAWVATNLHGESLCTFVAPLTDARIEITGACR
jgi:hypothetical protein